MKVDRRLEEAAQGRGDIGGTRALLYLAETMRALRLDYSMARVFPMLLSPTETKRRRRTIKEPASFLSTPKSGRFTFAVFADCISRAMKITKVILGWTYHPGCYDRIPKAIQLRQWHTHLLGSVTPPQDPGRIL